MSRTIVVRFLGALARIAGEREATVEIAEHATIGDVLEVLASRYDPRFAASIFAAPGRLHSYLRVFIDDEEAAVDTPVAHATTPRMSMLLFPAIEGGALGWDEKGTCIRHPAEARITPMMFGRRRTRCR